MTSLARRYRRGRLILRKNVVYKKTNNGKFIPDVVLDKKVARAIQYDSRFRNKDRMQKLTGSAIMLMAVVGLVLNSTTNMNEWLCYLLAILIVIVGMALVWKRIDGWLTKGMKKIYAHNSIDN